MWTRIDGGLVAHPAVLSTRLGRYRVAWVRSCAKAAVWRLVAVLPCRIWPEASALVRKVWPEVRHG